MDWSVCTMLLFVWKDTEKIVLMSRLESVLDGWPNIMNEQYRWLTIFKSQDSGRRLTWKLVLLNCWVEVNFLEKYIIELVVCRDEFSFSINLTRMRGIY